VYLEVDQVSNDVAYQGCTHEVDRMVIKADFEQGLPSQCKLQMTSGGIIYSTDHAEALHIVQTVIARFNLVSVTILEMLACNISMNETRRHAIDVYD